MKQMIQRLAAILVLMLLLVMPVAAQGGRSNDNTPLDWLQFVIENNLHWYLFAILSVIVAGNLVPQSVLEKKREEARQTETPWDDRLVALLEASQMIKQFLETQKPTTSATTSSGGSYVEEARRIQAQPAPPAPTITIVRQPLNVPVNKNSSLNVAKSGMGNWGGEDKRAKDTPDGYEIFWQPLMAGDEYAPPPELNKRDDGLNVALSHRRGRLFIHQDISGVLLPGQRYLLAVRCQCEMKLKADADIKGAIAIRGQVLAGEAVIRSLNAWSPATTEDLSGGFQALWALEASRAYGNLSYQVLVEVGNIHAVPFDDLSKIVITAIELIPVAADYGNENLVRL